MLKVNEKDSLIVMFQELIQAVSNKPNDLRGAINDIPVDETTAKVKSILSKIFGAQLNRLN